MIERDFVRTSFSPQRNWKMMIWKFWNIKLICKAGKLFVKDWIIICLFFFLFDVICFESTLWIGQISNAKSVYLSLVIT